MAYDVAIVGAGFSGSMLLANLVRLSKKPLSVALIDPSPNVPLGTAYSTTRSEHLLNVPASRMGAFHDNPRGFYEWLQARRIALGENDFAPRLHYGAYLRDIFAETLRLARQRNITITQINTAVTDITAIPAAAVVLCTGNRFVPFAAPGKRYITDVWHFDPGNLPPDTETIALIGTGLTAVDVLASLHRANWKGKIVTVSRHAAFPQPHTEVETPWPCAWDIAPPHLSALLHTLRRQIKAAAAENIPWQCVLDSLRPHTKRLWAALPAADQKRVFSRYMTLWNTHRHRMPQSALHMIESLPLTRIQGRVTGVEVYETHATVRLENSEINASLVFDCTGPRLQDSPLLHRLVESGLAQRCANGVGLVADASLRISKHDALPVYAVGSLLTGMFLESTAVPELRAQAHTVAAALAG